MRGQGERQKSSEGYMRFALDEARRGLGRTSPNPAVGAVLVKGRRIIARGFHARAGGTHAEVVAIEAAGAASRGADLYTTLEPCHHFGRTPPCTTAILHAGIRRVFCGSQDPNPLVRGRGIAHLRRKGVQVFTGVCRGEADALNEPFFKVMRQGLAYVTAKVATTLDGKIADAGGHSRWISGEASRACVHRLRNEVDAVLVGANTVRRDDPLLTARIPGGKNPVRVVLDSRLSLPLDRNVFRTQQARTVVATLESESSAQAKQLLRRGVEVWRLPRQGLGVDLKRLLQRLTEGGFNHVLAEGGAAVYGALFRDLLVDELWMFLAPKLLGTSGLSWAGLDVKRMERALSFELLSTERVGDDLLVRARPRRSSESGIRG
jgi:diaminohydroxyphosphoribosylaminopyrimidine deaminase / 5-amino-6-(5-phosphoribosylamino)uracil reductase